MGLDGAQITVTISADVSPLAAVNREMVATSTSADKLASSFKYMAAAGAPASDAIAATAPAAAAASNAMRGMSASMSEARLIQGAMTNESTALAGGMARLALQSSTLGPILQAAFPAFLAVGAIEAISGMVDWLDRAQEASSVARTKWDDFDASIIKQSGSLQIENLNLEDTIAKLEGHPEPNKLAIELLRAKTNADELQTSLENDVDKMQKLAEDGTVGLWSALFSGTVSTNEVTDAMEKPLQDYHQALADLADFKDGADKTDIERARENAEEKRKLALSVAEAQVDAVHQQMEAASKGTMAGGEGGIYFQPGQSPEEIEKRFSATLTVALKYRDVLQEMGTMSDAGAQNASLEAQAAAAQDAADKLKAHADALKKSDEAGRKAADAARKDAEALRQLASAKLDAAEITSEAQADAEEKTALAAASAITDKVAAIRAETQAKLDAATEESGGRVTKMQGEEKLPGETLAQTTVLDAQIAAEKTKLAGDLVAIAAEGAQKEAAVRQKEAADAAEAARKNTEEQMGSYDRVAEAATTSANKQLEAAHRIDDEKLEGHEESLRKWTSDEEAALDVWRAQQESAVNAALGFARQNYAEDTAQYQDAVRKKEQLDQEYAERHRQIVQQAQKDQEKALQQELGQFNGTITKMALQEETFKQGMAQIWKQIETDAINAILKIAERWLVEQVIMKAASVLFGSSQSGNSKQNQNIASNAADVESDAAAASADVFLQAIESIPFPANLIAAPAMAATVHGEVIGIAAAAQGHFFESGGIATFEKNETILPPDLGNGLRRMIAGSAGGSSSSSTTHNTYHVRPVVTINHQGTEMTDADVIKSVRRGIRKGMLSAA